MKKILERMFKRKEPKEPGMPKEKKQKPYKEPIQKDKPLKPKPEKKEKTMLQRGIDMNKKYNLEQNKTVYDVYHDIEKKKEKEDRWFEDKLKKIRDETRQVLLDEDTHAIKYLTKNQQRSQIIGAKEYVSKEQPKKEKIYSYYARKYGIPYGDGVHKKTLADLVRDIHTYEMKHRDDIISKRELDPVTKTYGLYIL